MVAYSIFLVLPAWCFSANLKHVYVQTGEKVLNLEKAIAKSNGCIVPTNKASTYLIITNGKKTIIDFSSEADVRMKMKALYPEQIIVKISFLQVKPNKTVFFDNVKVDTIPSNGNLDMFYPVSSGGHKIELRNSMKTVDLAIVDIESESPIECWGRSKMLCKITNIN